MFVSVGMGAIYEDVEENAVTAKVVIYDLVKGEHEIKRAGGSDDAPSVSSAKDGLGNISLGSAKNVQYVEARYLNNGSNIVTTPAMMQGEQVEIFRTKGTDRFYFKLFNLDKDLRRKETVVFAVSNKDKAEDHGEHFDKESSYSFTVSTKEKLIELKTSITDEEPVLFTISLNTKDGVFTIKDDQDQHLIWDGKNGTLDIKMPKITMNGEEFEFNAKSKINIKTGEMTVKAKSSTFNSKVTFKKAVNFTASVNFVGSVKMNGNAMTSDKSVVL